MNIVTSLPVVAQRDAIVEFAAAFHLKIRVLVQILCMSVSIHCSRSWRGTLLTERREGIEALLELSKIVSSVGNR